MNKQVLVVAVFLIAVAMLATPVMAKSPKKIPVKIIRSGWGTGPHEWWITPGNVIHGRDGLATWSNYNIMNVDSEGNPIGDKVACLGGFYAMTGKYEVNLNNPGTPYTTPFGQSATIGTGFNMLKVEIDYGDGNTFKGIMTIRGTFIVFDTEGPLAGVVASFDGIQRSVLQGTGIYQGWTLIWERQLEDGTTPYVYWDAYMLIP